MTPRPAAAQGARRGREDDGSGVVEMAFVGILLLMIVFGIINYGLLLSFKQDMTRAAAEGARAGAVALPVGSLTGTDDPRHVAAVTATDEAVRAFGGRFKDNGCTTDGMSCVVSLVEPCEDGSDHDCVTVTLEFDQENHKLYGRIPFFSDLPPHTIRAESVARVNQ